MLSRVPLTFCLEASAFDQQVQRPLRVAIVDDHSQGFWCLFSVLKPGTDQPQQSLDEARGLPHGHAEEDFHRQADLDHGIAILRQPALLVRRWRHPSHVRIEPDLQ